jgi:hypothetical protein
LAIETTAPERFLIVAADGIQEGNSVGLVRRWTRQFDLEFALERSHEEITTPKTLGLATACCRPDMFNRKTLASTLQPHPV